MENLDIVWKERIPMLIVILHTDVSSLDTNWGHIQMKFNYLNICGEITFNFVIKLKFIFFGTFKIIF